jgi:uncharacterized protein YkwD
VSTPPQPRSFAVALLTAVVLASPASSGARTSSYLAPVGYCSGARAQVMLCLHDYARKRAGLPALRASTTLTRAARAKSADIARCGFSHTACGHPCTYRVDWAGYSWTRIGENIAWGTGPLASARSIFSAWLRSPEHRANILDPAFRDVGIGSRRGTVAGRSDARIWVAELGRH